MRRSEDRGGGLAVDSLIIIVAYNSDLRFLANPKHQIPNKFYKAASDFLDAL